MSLASCVETVEDQLSVIDHLEADLDAKLKNAQALRQAILRYAFTGQLVPQDPNDEPASKLLERIAAEREARAREAAAAKESPNKSSRRKQGSTKTLRSLDSGSRLSSCQGGLHARDECGVVQGVSKETPKRATRGKKS